MCGPTVEALPWVNGKSTISVPLMLMFAFWAKLISYSGVAKTFNATYKQVFEAVEYVVGFGLEHRNLSGITAIGIDEIQVKLGHVYMTLVYQIDVHCRRLLWMGEGRTEEVLDSFFDEFTSHLSTVKYVCSDMWRAYLNVIKLRLPSAINILDRFHIVQNLNKAMDKVRREETRTLRAKGFEPHLTGTRWCFLKRVENLTLKQADRLKETLKYNLQSTRAYLLKEDFQRLWTYNKPARAAAFLDGWCKAVMYSKITPLKKFARSMKRHKPLIINYFKAKKEFSSGAVEGMNSYAKLAMRKSFGFKTKKALQITLFHQLGNLPEPQLTHRLW
jgi:transposase